MTKRLLERELDNASLEIIELKARLLLVEGADSLKSTRDVYDVVKKGEICSLKLDKARLDWLERLANVKIWEQLSKRWTISRDVSGLNEISADTLRAAIDGAIAAEAQTPSA